MGIRFQCHHCGHPLHVKDFQAGRKGRCPECKGQFRIPLTDAQFSLDPKANQNAADSAITGAASSSASSLVTSSLATADAVTQRTIAPRSTTNHRSTTPQSTSSTINSLNDGSQNNDTRDNALLSNSSLLEQDSLPEYVIDSQAAAAAESFESAESPLSPVDDSQPSQGNDELIQPKVIAEAPSATWYVRPAAGGQYGPAPTEIMWQWLVEGRVGVDSLVWRDDWPEWHPANQVFAEFFNKMLGESISNPNVYDQAALASPTQSGYANAESSAPTYLETQPTNQGAQYGNQQASRVATHPIVTIDSQQPVAGAATVVNKREARKRSRRVKYTAAIAILVALLLGLGVGLVIVLYKQGVTQ